MKAKNIRDTKLPKKENLRGSVNEVDEEKKKLEELLKVERIKNQNLMDENNNLKNKINILTNNISNLNIRITYYINQIKSLENKNNNKNNNNISNKNITNNNSMNYYKNNLNDIQINNSINITSINKGEKIFSINFVSMGFQDIGHYSLAWKNTDIFVRLEEKLNNDYPQLKDKETYFISNGRRIKRFKTLDENKIKGNDIINLFVVDDEN